MDRRGVPGLIVSVFRLIWRRRFFGPFTTLSRFLGLRIVVEFAG